MIMEFFLSVLCVLFMIHCIIRYSRKGRMFSKIAGPPSVPILGNIFHFIANRKDMRPPPFEYNQKYYPVWRAWTFHFVLVFILHPDDIKALLSNPKHIEKSRMYEVLDDWLNNGLLTSTGELWQHRRKMLSAAFHFEIFKLYAEVILEHGVKLADKLKAENNEVVVELKSFLTKFTLGAICEAAMGTPLEDIDDREIEEYKEAIRCVAESVDRLARPWLHFKWIFYNFTKLGRKTKTAIKTLHAFSTKIIRKREEYHKQTGGKYLKNIADEENGGFTKIPEKRMAMLDLLIAASNDGLIDEDGIREEVDTFILGGHDTLAIAITHAVQLLAEHPDIQARAREEVDQMFESCKGKITMSNINKLPYLEQCVKETLRLYPSLPFIGRRLRGDLHLQNNLIVPSGADVSVCIYDLHRNPRFWPKPNKFDPDRFLLERSLQRKPYSYIPFSYGPRNCLGRKFAMLEMKTFCAHILRNFYLEAIDLHAEFSPIADITLRGEKVIRAKFIPIRK